MMAIGRFPTATDRPRLPSLTLGRATSETSPRSRPSEPTLSRRLPARDRRPVGSGSAPRSWPSVGGGSAPDLRSLSPTAGQRSPERARSPEDLGRETPAGWRCAESDTGYAQGLGSHTGADLLCGRPVSVARSDSTGAILGH